MNQTTDTASNLKAAIEAIDARATVTLIGTAKGFRATITLPWIRTEYDRYTRSNRCYLREELGGSGRSSDFLHAFVTGSSETQDDAIKIALEALCVDTTGPLSQIARFKPLSLSNPPAWRRKSV
jgi:hypothetical protein